MVDISEKNLSLSFSIFTSHMKLLVIEVSGYILKDECITIMSIIILTTRRKEEN